MKFENARTFQSNPLDFESKLEGSKIGKIVDVMKETAEI